MCIYIYIYIYIYICTHMIRVRRRPALPGGDEAGALGDNDNKVIINDNE